MFQNKWVKHLHKHRQQQQSVQAFNEHKQIKSNKAAKATLIRIKTTKTN